MADIYHHIEHVTNSLFLLKALQMKPYSTYPFLPVHAPFSATHCISWLLPPFCPSISTHCHALSSDQANHPFFICVPVLRQLVLSVCAQGFVHFSVAIEPCVCVPCCMLVCLYLSSQHILLHYAPGCLFL